MTMTKRNNRKNEITNLEFRVQQSEMMSNGDMIVSGYVNMTNTLSHELGFTDKFVEKIAPGAFGRALDRAEVTGEEIDFLAEHDDSLVLASTKNDSLQLREDDTGLFMEAKIINTSTGRDYYEMIKSGIVTSMSFGFFAIEDEWDVVHRDLYERTVTELELFEVSAVRRPAYAASSISNRGLKYSNDVVPDNIKEESSMEERTANNLQKAIETLTAEVRELRGTIGKDKDGNNVNVQKDNYATGQQTSKQQGKEAGEVGEGHKVIKDGEDTGKYAGDKEIDDKGSYNHDTKVPTADENGNVSNKPESQSGKTAKYDGSHPDEVPGRQNGESDEDNTGEEDTSSGDTSDDNKDTSSGDTSDDNKDTSSGDTSNESNTEENTETNTDSEGSATTDEGRSLDTLSQQFAELRGGNK